MARTRQEIKVRATSDGRWDAFTVHGQAWAVRPTKAEALAALRVEVAALAADTIAAIDELAAKEAPNG